MSEQCLELKNVCKSFRDFTLNNISFTLPQGYIMGLVGPNGAGKTTTIQLILNMLEKDAGKILVFGKDNVSFWKFCKIISEMVKEVCYSQHTLPPIWSA